MRYTFSSTSLTWDAITFPSTTSSTIVLIFLVLVGSKHHKQNKTSISQSVKDAKPEQHTFKVASCYHKLSDVLKWNRLYYFIYLNDFRNSLI